MSNFTGYSNDEVIVHLLVYHYSYWEEYNKSLFEELKNRGVDFADFDNNEYYIKLFINSFPGGWSEELQNMFNELLSFGWNKSMFLRAKEKWGYFQCEGTNFSDELKFITDKYTERINKKCSRCGSENFVQTQGFWVELICRKCSHDDYQVKGIYNISDIGFDYQNHHSTKKEFLWEEITDIEFTFIESKQIILMETNRTIDAPYNMPESLEFQMFYNLNFLKLLINIPNHLLNDSEIQKRNNFLNSLKDCYFCGKRTLHLEICLLCKKSLSQLLSSRKNRYMKFFNNISFAIDEQKEETKEFIEYSNDLNLFYYKDYFLD